MYECVFVGMYKFDCFVARRWVSHAGHLDDEYSEHSADVRVRLRQRVLARHHEPAALLHGHYALLQLFVCGAGGGAVTQDVQR